MARTTRGGRSFSAITVPVQGSKKVASRPSCTTCVSVTRDDLHQHAAVEARGVLAFDQVGLVERVRLASGDRVGIHARRERLQQRERLDVLHRDQVRRAQHGPDLERELRRGAG